MIKPNSDPANFVKLSPKTQDVGGIPVARLLPQAKYRTIGAWCFLDHAGPAIFDQEDLKGMQVGLHPHINLQTFTWMLSGEMLHQDSLGNRQIIRPEEVNLMTAGTGDKRGISHTEQTPDGVDSLHAVQLWIALPVHQEIEPSFYHYPDLPKWQDNGVNYILINGRYQGYAAPTLQYSPLLALDVQLPCDAESKSLDESDANSGQVLRFERKAGVEYGIFVIQGEVGFADESFFSESLLLLKDFATLDTDGTFEIWAERGSHFLVLGGEPLPHKTLFWWNFVSDNPESLVLAVQDWNAHHARFGDIDLQGSGLRRLPAPIIPENMHFR